MPDSKYQETIDWLFKQFPSYQLIGSAAYKPTLENISRICSSIGDPQESLRFIHIAGTNGKGSSSAMLASILTTSGEKVGLFTSPHILDFRERIRVNGQMIAEEVVIEFVNRIKGIQFDFEPSFFEITFAMALDHFRKSDCSVCVIETGLGGRLDATNIITPLACLITNISLEHTQILGSTLEQIAGEKAGIIKKNIPIIIGERKDSTGSVFETKALKENAPISYAEDVISNERLKQFKTPLLGSYQQNNLRGVLAILNVIDHYFPEIDDLIIQKGLDNLYKNTGFFGRMQIKQREPLVIFDVSHNFDGIKSTLDDLLKDLKGDLYILYGSSSDKEVLPILQLLPNNVELHLTTFKNQRSFSKEQLEKIASLSGKPAQIHSSPQKGLEEILSKAKKEDTVLVFGSFFLLSDLMA
jgi:dihydrofolate synthase / folylpolyglutamate synthase